MGDLVDSIVRVFEFLIQGILAVCVVGFALVWFHPVKRALFTYAHEIHRFVFGKKEVSKEVVTLVLLGLVYFLGILTNVIGYWVLEPVHHLAILDADRTWESTHGQAGRSEEAAPKFPIPTSTALLPLTRVIRDVKPQDQVKAYANYVHQEVKWRNCNLEALSHALDPQIKQFRIIRGTIVCSLAICGLALAKSLYFMMIALIWALLRRSQRAYWLVDMLYKHTVDPSAMESPKRTPDTFDGGFLEWLTLNEPRQPPEAPPRQADKDRRLRQTFKYAGAALTVSGLALCLYLLSLSGWHTVEREYHLMVRFGSDSCTPGTKKAANDGMGAAVEDPSPDAPLRSGTLLQLGAERAGI